MTSETAYLFRHALLREADEKTGILPWSEELEKKVRERIGKK